MNTRTIDGQAEDQLKERFLEAWQTGHGGSAERVHLLTAQDSLAVIIPKAMYQAEITLFKNTSHSAKVLDQYLRSLLVTISDELQPEIEEFTGREISNMVPLIDLKAGYITALYRFR